MSADDAMPLAARRDHEPGAGSMARPDCRSVAGGLLLVAAAIMFVYEIKSVSEVNGWWLDELVSVLFTDPARSFRFLLRNHILRDPTPPLYYVLLAVMRRFVGDPRTAILVLNGAAIGVAGLWVSLIARGRGTRGWIDMGGGLGFALAGFAAVLLSGPVVRFTVEGRCYLIALMLVYVSAWLSALALMAPARRPAAWIFPILGGLAALTHVYAGLFCCCLAAGLASCSLLFRRRDLMAAGLTLGSTAAAILVVWILLFGWDTATQVEWIVFSAHDTAVAGYEVKQMIFGGWPAVVAFAVIFIASLFMPRTRPLAALFGVSAALFIAIPCAMSLVHPIIVGRYWLVGAPMVVVFLLFVALSGWQAPATRRLHRLAGACALALLPAMAASGFTAARDYTAQKLIWRGAAFVGPLLSRCGPGSVHVNQEPALFALAAHAPESTFLDVDGARPGWDGQTDAGCPVLGWAEHVRMGDDFIDAASNHGLLDLLRIEASPAVVTIHRFGSGFVVLRTDG